MPKRSFPSGKSACTIFYVCLCTVLRKNRLNKILPILSFIQNRKLNYDTKGNRSVIREHCNKGTFIYHKYFL